MQNIQSFNYFLKKFPDYKTVLLNTKNDVFNFTKYNDELGVFRVIDIGMGCFVYLKYNFKFKNILGYFLHGDHLVQYGINDIPNSNNFVKNIDLFKYLNNLYVL